MCCYLFLPEHDIGLLPSGHDMKPLAVHAHTRCSQGHAWGLQAVHGPVGPLVVQQSGLVVCPWLVAPHKRLHKPPRCGGVYVQHGPVLGQAGVCLHVLVTGPLAGQHYLPQRKHVRPHCRVVFKHGLAACHIRSGLVHLQAPQEVANGWAAHVQDLAALKPDQQVWLAVVCVCDRLDGQQPSPRLQQHLQHAEPRPRVCLPPCLCGRGVHLEGGQASPCGGQPVDEHAVIRIRPAVAEDLLYTGLTAQIETHTLGPALLIGRRNHRELAVPCLARQVPGVHGSTRIWVDDFCRVEVEGPSPVLAEHLAGPVAQQLVQAHLHLK
eukprot:comp24248_c1_seq1/m.44871 comp24248_c1_seq1/g.44871  ORF comp24248_c1_seq1/g.44871 comp24248_c1_seq1/m.44871 type:complete len:323 (+) comp24248_c1_seq1:128-1096(+)